MLGSMLHFLGDKLIIWSMSVISCQKQKAWTSLDSKGENNLSFLVYSYLVSFNCCCLVAKSYMTLLWPNGLEPARLLCPWDFPDKNTGWGEWVATSLSWESSGPRDPTWVSCIVGRFFTAEPVGKRVSIVNVATYCHHGTDEESEALSGAPCRVSKYRFDIRSVGLQSLNCVTISKALWLFLYLSMHKWQENLYGVSF